MKVAWKVLNVEAGGGQVRSGRGGGPKSKEFGGREKTLAYALRANSPPYFNIRTQYQCEAVPASAKAPKLLRTTLFRLITQAFGAEIHVSN